jgi:hypothetical protein
MVDRAKLATFVAAAAVGAVSLAAALVYLAIWLRRRRASVVAGRTRSLESSTATLRADGAASLDSSVVSVSVSEGGATDWGHNPLPPGKRVAFWGWRGSNNDHPPLSVSGIPKYHYKYGNLSLAVTYSSVAAFHILKWRFLNVVSSGICRRPPTTSP